jgi:hypothetical protein
MYLLILEKKILVSSSESGLISLSLKKWFGWGWILEKKYLRVSSCGVLVEVREFARA